MAIAIDSTGIYVDGVLRLVMPTSEVDLEALYEGSKEIDGGDSDSEYSVVDPIIESGGA